MQFDIIDTKTGWYPDVEKIALSEDWAKGLIYCYIDCFALQGDGTLILIDDCGNIAYPPAGRFEVVPVKGPNEPLTLEHLRASPHGKIKDSTLQNICNRANEIACRPPEGEEDT